MASLLIRNVDDFLHARLKRQAAAHRRSLEEEARELLRRAVARQELDPQEHPVVLAGRLFGRKHGGEVVLPPRGSAPRSTPPDFSGPDFER